MTFRFHNRSGSVLPVVFAFAVIAALTVMAYVSGQYLLARPAFFVPAQSQALLNARSGIWKGLERLKEPSPDTLKTINTMDSLFNKDLFGKPTEAISPTNESLVPDGEPLAVDLFHSDSFGSCEISFSYRGCMEILRSKGMFRNREKNVVVVLGGTLGRAFSPRSDTVLYLPNSPPLQTPIRGKVSYKPFDSVCAVRTDDLKKLISHYTAEMTDSTDTMRPSPPRLVQYNYQFDTLPKVVKGDLFIDGSHFDLRWISKKRIVVLGNLQITGTVNLEGMDFIAGGDIKCLDKSLLGDVFLFTPKTITIGDRATFRGTAMAQGNILVYGDASVQKKSILVVARKAAAQAPSQKNDGAAIAGLKPPNAPAGGKKIFGLGSSIQAKPGVFSVTFTGNATVSAMVITLDDSLGVKIDRNVIDSGIIRTHGAVSLDGRFWGRIFASKFVDGAAAVSGKPAPPLAVIHGSILPLDDMAGYRIPCFMGALSIVEWRED